MVRVRVSQAPTGRRSPDGLVNIEVLYANENIWLTQKKMAELFEGDRWGEFDERSVCAKFARTAEDSSVV